jgi:L-iditol 2-dehydrogenase
MVTDPIPPTAVNGDHNRSTNVKSSAQPALKSVFETLYDPTEILTHPEFKLLKEGDKELTDKEANLGCFYNPKHEVNMVNKPVPKARAGECIVHVRATGICG